MGYMHSKYAINNNICKSLHGIINTCAFIFDNSAHVDGIY